jgi:hypothetical protein
MYYWREPMNFTVSELSFCQQFALIWTSKNDITMVQRNVKSNDSMNQTRHLLSLLTMVLQSIIDGCKPDLGEIRRLNAFLSSSHSVRGNTSLSTNQLTDWIARLCEGMRGKLKYIHAKPTHKRKRVPTPITDHAQPALQSVLRYAFLRVNSQNHGLNDRLMYNVSWHEPGSSNTMEPYANIHHLEALTKYEERFESSTDTKNYYKALDLCQRNKERDAMLSEDDIDSEMTEAEPRITAVHCFHQPGSHL